MKNYDPVIAAKKLVISNTQHGLSRHKFPELAKEKISGVLTEVAHVSSLTQYAKWLIETKEKHLKNSNIADAQKYLEYKASTCLQSTVSLACQSINFHILRASPIPFVAAKTATIPKDRAYTRKQIDLLVEMAHPALGLAILLAEDAGLREMELLSIAEVLSLNESDRPWCQERFSGRSDDVAFVVWGKGRLVRQVRLSESLAERMRELLRPFPVRVAHRTAHLISHFELLGGHLLSSQFGRLSMHILGFSNGAHGLRHSFAQRRRNELLCCGFSLDEAVLILSQELGHFSIKNTIAYLRDE